MTLILNLTDEQRALAESEWKKVVGDGQTTTTSVEEWFAEIFAPIFQPLYDEKVAAAANSWRPEDSPEVAKRRDEATQKLLSIPEDKLPLVEAILAQIAEEKAAEAAADEPVTETP